MSSTAPNMEHLSSSSSGAQKFDTRSNWEIFKSAFAKVRLELREGGREGGVRLVWGQVCRRAERGSIAVLVSQWRAAPVSTWPRRTILCISTTGGGEVRNFRDGNTFLEETVPVQLWRA